MASRRDHVFHTLHRAVYNLTALDEASLDDCLEACRELYADLVASAAFVHGDTLAEYESRIACTKAALEAAIRVRKYALRHVMAEKGV